MPLPKPRRPTLVSVFCLIYRHLPAVCSKSLACVPEPQGGFPASSRLPGTTSSPSCSPCLGPRPAPRPRDTRTSPLQSQGFLCPGAGAGAAPFPSSESVPHPSSLVVPVGRTRALCVFWGAPPGLAGASAWLCWPPCPVCPPSHSRQASELCASPAP